MKRLFIIASLAILAVGCQKTEIQNEVQTPIGFSTETGKMTRAIVQNDPSDPTADVTYPTNQPFGVFAYGWQEGAPNDAAVMDNVEVAYVSEKWSANDNITYYWPNDPRTTLNFYAYSPYIQRSEVNTDKAPMMAADDDKVMTVTNLSYVETIDNGDLTGAVLSFEEYEHSNMYVDFMVAQPVVGAKYSFPDGGFVASNNAGTVPLVFEHKMTQVLFSVTTDHAYPGVTFTVNRIKLKNIKNVADYSNGEWAPSISTDDYPIFPADTDKGAVSVNIMSTTDNTVEAPFVFEYANNATEVLAAKTTTGVTMIPQEMAQATSSENLGEDRYAEEAIGQMFEIEYEIKGTGVAEETVIKHVPFYAADATKTVVDWDVNKRITYIVKIGLKEIYFEPYVSPWTDEDGDEYDYVNPDGFEDVNGEEITPNPGE